MTNFTGLDLGRNFQVRGKTVFREKDESVCDRKMQVAKHSMNTQSSIVIRPT